MTARRGPLPLFDRGPYFEGKKSDGAIAWPDGWQDPDADWRAETGRLALDAAE